LVSLVFPMVLLLSMVLVAIGVAPPAPWGNQTIWYVVLSSASWFAPAGLILSFIGLQTQPRKYSLLGIVVGAVGTLAWYFTP